VRRLARLALLAALPGSCGAVACGGSERPATAARPALAGVIVLCVDTLRADAVAPSRSGPALLPSVAEFARDATAFADATAAAPWTGPSVASLVTGLLPSRHGLDVGFDEAASKVMSPAVPTLATRLRAEGWFTSACTAGGWVTPLQGLGQGFDYFSSDFDRMDPGEFVAQWQERRPKDRPYLLFLHTFVAHDPYGDKSGAEQGRCSARDDAVRLADAVSVHLDRGDRVPADLFGDAIVLRWGDACDCLAFEDRLGAVRVQNLLAGTLAWTQGGWRDDAAAGQSVARRLRAAYDAGLSALDRRLERTFAALREAGAFRDAAIVFAGDHGEAFGEGGCLYHGQSLHDAVLRVPLIVRAPGRLPGGVEVRGGCSLVDVLPTVLDLAGLPAAEGIQGRSLVPLAVGTGRGSPAVAEGRRAATATRPEIGLVSVRVPEAKYVLEYDVASGAIVREMLFDLVGDPHETEPLAPAQRPYGASFAGACAGARAEVVHRALGGGSAEPASGRDRGPVR
jgi:arylsulfatase A-like enzyme